MSIRRIFVTLLVALSVVMLPIGGSFAIASATATVSMTDCCEHHSTPCDKTNKAMDDCCSMAACAIKCFNFTGADVSGVALLPIVSAVGILRESLTLRSQSGTPPLHPPQV